MVEVGSRQGKETVTGMDGSKGEHGLTVVKVDLWGVRPVY